jgi:hypothetical protein
MTMRTADERCFDDGGSDEELAECFANERRRELAASARRILEHERHDRERCAGPDCPHHEGEEEIDA